MGKDVRMRVPSRDVFYVPWSQEQTSIIKKKIRFLTSFKLKSECWIWQDALNRDGYALIWIFNNHFSAHRVAYKAWIGELDPELELDHTCRNRACVNPWHLEQVTTQVNVLRGNNAAARNARKTHCPRGHVLIPRKDHPGWRYCPLCYREQMRMARRRHRQQESSEKRTERLEKQKIRARMNRLRKKMLVDRVI